jgi:hypothetical protein
MDELRSNPADILEFRMHLTYRIAAVLALFGSPLTVPDVERLIFEEDPSRHPSDYFADLLTLLKADESNLDAIYPVIQDAWNYLPHRSLGGRCPAEVMAGLK